MASRRRSSCYGAYSKIDKEDPEEIIHRRAQFLIYKALQQADHNINGRRKPSFLRIRLCRLKIKIGNKLKKMRKSLLLTMSAARVRVYKQLSCQWKRFFASSTPHTTAVSTIFP